MSCSSDGVYTHFYCCRDVSELRSIDEMDALEQFVTWFLKESPRFGLIPSQDAVTSIEGVTAVLWYRHEQFQVQQFIVPPNYVIPAHIHPNVDSFELYLGGQIQFSKNGKFEITSEESTRTGQFGEAAMRGKMIRVRPHEWHGGTFGAAGGVFMSLQHWLNGVKPHCVAADYSGATMGPDHFAKVKAGTPVLRTQADLTEADVLKT